ncbi:aldo/keto reductase family protein [Gluconacetobacter diazotrophicus]|nr:aldo/keto reductase family protein [Gluconacetobacter diazotrophicus]
MTPAASIARHVGMNAPERSGPRLPLLDSETRQNLRVAPPQPLGIGPQPFRSSGRQCTTQGACHGNPPDYDLYYIHWPNPSQDRYVEAWRALIEAKKRGMIRSIAVCNFLPDYIQRLIDETGVAPSINQVELSPYFPQDDLRAWHAAHGIATQAWSPLGRANRLTSDPLLGKIAARLDRSIPQVVLRWHHQVGAVPIPKLASRARQIENMSIFDFALTDEDMASIATLARPDGRTFDQDPARHEEF